MASRCDDVSCDCCDSWTDELDAAVEMAEEATRKDCIRTIRRMSEAHTLRALLCRENPDVMPWRDILEALGG